jgi:uncharacterized protein YqgC (DUF456 family)
VSAAEIVLGLVMLAGLVGVLLPILPGLFLILGAGVVWIPVADPGPLGWVVVGVMALLALAGTAATVWIGGRRAVRSGAPRWVLAAGAFGTVVGFFVIPVIGALIGGPIGIFVAELARVRDVPRAWASTVEAVKGVGLGIVVQFVAGVAMIAVWVVGVLTI